MKIIMIIVGSLAGLYAVLAIIQFIQTLMVSDTGTTYGGTNIAASIVPMCIGLALCFACFQQAFRKPPVT